MKSIGRSFWVLAHLEQDYAYDAFVTQVLTGSQLAKTHHLPAERWTITPLGQDRHLVQHVRPERFEQGATRIQAVPQDVLDQTREDFGGAIRTTQTLEEHPPPLPIEEQIRACDCGRLSTAGLPAHVTAPTCYGPGVAALGAYLMGCQHLRWPGTAELRPT